MTILINAVFDPREPSPGLGSRWDRSGVPESAGGSPGHLPGSRCGPGGAAGKMTFLNILSLSTFLSDFPGSQLATEASPGAGTSAKTCPAPERSNGGGTVLRLEVPARRHVAKSGFGNLGDFEKCQKRVILTVQVFGKRKFHPRDESLGPCRCHHRFGRVRKWGFDNLAGRLGRVCRDAAA